MDIHSFEERQCLLDGTSNKYDIHYQDCLIVAPDWILRLDSGGKACMIINIVYYRDIYLMQVYMYIYIYIYMYACIHLMWILQYYSMVQSSLVYYISYVCVYIYIYICIYIYIYIYACIHFMYILQYYSMVQSSLVYYISYVCVYIYIYICIYIYIYMYIVYPYKLYYYICMYIYIYIYVCM